MCEINLLKRCLKNLLKENMRGEIKIWILMWWHNLIIDVVLQVPSPWEKANCNREWYRMGKAKSSTNWYSLSWSSYFWLFEWFASWWSYRDSVEEKQRIPLWFVLVSILISYLVFWLIKDVIPVKEQFKHIK